jgi:predicted Zn-dependent protease
MARAGAGEPDDTSESAVGDRLALEGLRRYGLPVEDQSFQKYVNLVGNAVARNSNIPNIPLHFVVVQSPLYHSFSCPGGIIFLTSAFVKAMEDESQLAGVLAHEVSHVGYRHAVQSIRGAKSSPITGKSGAATVKERKGGKSSAATVKERKGSSNPVKAKKGDSFQEMVSSLQTVLFDEGLDQNMEFEADLSGMEAAYRTGYDPAGLVNVLKMLQIKERAAQKKGSWFSTHPPLGLRIQRCGERLRSYPDALSLAKVKNRFISYQKRL